MADPHAGAFPYLVPDRAGLPEIVESKKPGPIGKPPVLIETGLDDLDATLGGGLRVGEVSIVAGYTGGGKSAFVDQLALHASQRTHTLYFAYEMGRDRVTERLLGKMLRTDVQSVSNLKRTVPTPPKLLAALDALAYDHNLKLDERDLEVPNTVELFTRIVHSTMPKLVIIDDLSYFDEWYPPATNPVTVRKNIMRRLVNIAQGFEVHVLCVHQTKSDTMSKTQRPNIGDLADSHHVAKAADTVLLLHRPFRGQGFQDRVVEMIVAKNRNGPVCTLHTEWHGPTMSYRQMLPDEEAQVECCRRKK